MTNLEIIQEMERKLSEMAADFKTIADDAKTRASNPPDKELKLPWFWMRDGGKWRKARIYF